MYNIGLGLYKKIETKDYDDRVRMGRSDIYLSDMNSILVCDYIGKGFNNNLFDVGRAWYSSELIGDKMKTIKLDDTIEPVIKRENKDFSQLYTPNEAMIYYRKRYNSNSYLYLTISDVVRIVLAVILFIIISAILLNYSRNKYKRWKWFRKYSSIELTLRPTFLSSLNLSLPNTKNGDEYGIWEMNSIYTNSVHSFEAEFSHYNEAIVLCRCNNTAASTNKTTKVNLNREITEFNIDSITNNIT
ncbi:hypothetical protein K502DRAFT_351121, partial [Neoconidiobolus thromboides FSU 785]